MGVKPIGGIGSGLPDPDWRVCRTFQPCFLAVEMTVRLMTKVFAPSSDRKPPEIFCLTLIMRPSCSAWLLVQGTSGLGRKLRTSSLRVLRGSKRL